MYQVNKNSQDPTTQPFETREKRSGVLATALGTEQAGVRTYGEIHAVE